MNYNSMIVVRVDTNKEGLITGYEVNGHAGLAEAGKDILCAAVSSITQTPILGMEQHLQRHPKVVTRDGVLQVQLDKADAKTQLLLMTMVSAIKQLAEDYPQNVRFEEQR